MLNKIKSVQVLLLFLAILPYMSCKKFLDEKSNQKLVIPSSVQDLQGLLDSYTRVNQFNAAAAEKSADDYYLASPDWDALSSEADKRMYNWQPAYLFKEGVGNDWANAYDNVYRANTVLNEIDKIPRVPNDELNFNACKGHAYFIRANTFLSIANIWAPAFDPNASSDEWGIPLRLDPDFNIPTKRSSVKETYYQVIADAKKGAELLPEVPLHILRPSKPAAHALLARTYLAMQQYDSSLKYANLSLQLKNDILDYNQLNPAASFPFTPRFSNPEIMYDSYMNSGTILGMARAKIDSFLYQSYQSDDLRKKVFFKNNNNGSFAFKGSYSGAAFLFDGLATDEVYLIKAECLARENNYTAAMNVLNSLLEKRWKAGTFIPYTAADAGEALNLILQERRKELLMRSIRWMDIKRLNKQGAAISLTRILNGEIYNLPPNDLRFALPIPEDVIALTGINQNPR